MTFKKLFAHSSEKVDQNSWKGKKLYLSNWGKSRMTNSKNMSEQPGKVKITSLTMMKFTDTKKWLKKLLKIAVITEFYD